MSTHCCYSMHTIVTSLIVAVLLTIPGTSEAFKKGGPNDYYDSSPTTRKYLRLVEGAHLNEAIKALAKGKTSYSYGTGKSGTVYHDLDYTLRWFPNHPRGLHEMAQFLVNFRKSKNSYIPPGVTPKKYFDAAIRFRPGDAVVRFVYGIHLHKAGDLNAALEQYLLAEELGLNSAELHYNLGLLYLDLKNTEKALSRANKAYQMGYPLPGLRMRLEKLGAPPLSSNGSAQK